MTNNHSYDDQFFDWVEQGAIRSAGVILPIMKDNIRLDSVVDIGCGSGGWLMVWNRIGIADVLGVDGDYVRQDRLRFDRERFLPVDLRHPLNIARRFDLAQSLEVGEHLPEESAGMLVSQLCRLADVVLFSAAQPGQGGEFHINEKPLEFWRGLFILNGFDAYDFIRPKIADQGAIEPWYKYNAVVYANAAGSNRLSAAVRETKMPKEARLPAGGDWRWRLRRSALGPLPVSTVTMLSKLNYRLRNALRSSRQV